VHIATDRVFGQALLYDRTRTDELPRKASERNPPDAIITLDGPAAALHRRGSRLSTGDRIPRPGWSAAA